MAECCHRTAFVLSDSGVVIRLLVSGGSTLIATVRSRWRLKRLADDAHAARAEAVEDLEVAEGLADHASTR